jgi:glycerophosphoryl diester phosphodiesterase
MRLQISFLLVVFWSTIGCTAGPTTPVWQTLDGQRPLVIAHRGDSGAFPEHTIEAYRSALKQRVDIIETDVVLTRDGVPICRHDLSLAKTTDVASRPEFADRASASFSVASFTRDEIKQLRAIQHMKGRDPSLDGRLVVPTLDELYSLVHAHNQRHGTNAGLLIEIKAAGKHQSMGLDVVRASYDLVQRRMAAGERVPVIFQCFERDACERLARWGGYPVHWLTSDPLDFNDLPRGINGLGLHKKLITLEDGRSPQIDQAHAMGLRVNAWTFRDDRLPAGVPKQRPATEMLPYLRAGVDGLIVDYPETALAAVQQHADTLREEAQAEAEQNISQRVRERSPRRMMKRSMGGIK